MIVLPRLDDLLAERERRLDGGARNHLLPFMKYTFKRRRGFDFIENWHHKVVCDALMDVFHGKTNRLIITLPPRYTKTEAAVVNFVSFCFGHVPDAEFIHVSYAATLAEQNSSNTQQLMLHESYADLFPKTKLSSTAKGHWGTTAGGSFYATGAAGTITGFGAGKMRPGFGGAIIIDDPHKPDEATSDTIRNGVIDWYQNTLRSRTNSPETPIIVIMQRLHEEDLAGWLLNGGSGEAWTHICLPAIGEDDEPLWAYKHDLETLREMERKSPYVFAGQYMQRPAPLGGGIFKDDHWRYYDWQNPPTRIKRIIQSWDTAFKVKQMNDFSACETWAECDSGFFLLDMWKGKLEYPALRRKVIEMAQQYNPLALLLEDKASGQSLIQDLRASTRLAIIPVTPVHDKVERANLVTPLIEAGRVFLPKGHPEVEAFVHEHSAFPNAAHDDWVDTTTQGLSFLSRNVGVQKIQVIGV